MKWTDPDFKDLRLGFEVTAYVYVRWPSHPVPASNPCCGSRLLKVAHSTC